MTSGWVNPNFRLDDQGISGLGNVYYNYLEPALIQEALKRDGHLGLLLLVTTGKFTGRSPKDKHVVKTPSVAESICGKTTQPCHQKGLMRYMQTC